MMQISSNNDNIKQSPLISGRKELSSTHHGGGCGEEHMKELILTHQVSELSSSSAPIALEESTATEPLWGENIDDDGDEQSYQKPRSRHEPDCRNRTSDSNRSDDGSGFDNERIGRRHTRSGQSRSGRSRSSHSRRSQRQSTHQSASEYTSTTTSVAEEFSTSRSTVSFAFFDDLDNEEDGAESAVPGVACASSSSTNGGGGGSGSGSRRVSHLESPGRVEYSENSGGESFTDNGDSTVGERSGNGDFYEEYYYQPEVDGQIDAEGEEIDVLSNLTLGQIRLLAFRMHQTFVEQGLLQDRRYHLKTYHNCFLHEDGMQWLADQVIELEQAEEQKRQQKQRDANVIARRSRMSGARSVVSTATGVNGRTHGQAILARRRMSCGDVADEEGTMMSMGTMRTDAAMAFPSLRSSRTPPPSRVAGSKMGMSSFALMQDYFDSIQEKAAQLGNYMVQGGYVGHVCNDHKFSVANKGRTLFFEFRLRDCDGSSHDGSSKQSNQSSNLSAVAANLLTMRLLPGHKNKGDKKCSSSKSSRSTSNSQRSRPRNGALRSEAKAYDESDITLTRSPSYRNSNSSFGSTRTASTSHRTGLEDGTLDIQPKTTKRRTIDKALLSLVRDMHTDFRHTKRIEDRMWHLKVYKQCMLHDDVMKWMTEEVQIHYQARSYDEPALQHHNHGNRSSKKHESSPMPASLSQRQAEEAAAMLANSMIQHGYLSHVCDPGNSFQAHDKAYLFFRFHSSVIGNDLHLSNLALLDEKGVDQLQGQLFEEVTLAVLLPKKRKGKSRKA